MIGIFEWAPRPGVGEILEPKQDKEVTHIGEVLETHCWKLSRVMRESLWETRIERWPSMERYSLRNMKTVSTKRNTGPVQGVRS